VEATFVAYHGIVLIYSEVITGGSQTDIYLNNLISLTLVSKETKLKINCCAAV
jgi:hypothetical protein